MQVQVRTTVWVALVAISLLCVYPILVTQNPPLHDYPFHLARMYILAHWDTSPLLQQHYTLSSFMLPNIAMDIIVPVLAHMMPVEMAGRLFLASIVVLQISGCVMLYRSIHGHYSLWPLVSAFFVFNWIFVFGFLNYLFGIGLLLWATAIWIALPRRSLPLNILCGMVLATVLFFCHMIVVGLFAVIVAGWELGRAVQNWSSNRRRVLVELAAGASIFIVPAILYVASSTAQASGATSHKLGNVIRLPLIFARILLSADWTLDIILLATIVTFLALVMSVGRTIVARSMYLVISFLVITYIVIPHEMSGGWGVDSRIAVLIIFMVIASIQPTFNLFWSRIVVCVLFASLVVRSVLLTHEWHKYDEVYTSFRQAFTMLPPDSTLFVATEDGIPSLQDIDLYLWQPPLEHVATLAVFDNVFVPQTWAKFGQQPIVIKPQYRALYDFQSNRPLRLATKDELHSVLQRAHEIAPMAYLLVLYPRTHKVDLPQSALVAEGERFMLLKLWEDQNE